MFARVLTAGLFAAGLSLPCLAEDAAPVPKPEAQPAEGEAPRPIRNAPDPRGFMLTAYIYAAQNVCGYRIGVSEFETLLTRHGIQAADVAPRGRFAQRVMGPFTMMSNQILQNREQACLAIAAEYGPEGTIAKNVLQPGGAPPSDAKPAEGAPAAKPAQ